MFHHLHRFFATNRNSIKKKGNWLNFVYKSGRSPPTKPKSKGGTHNHHKGQRLWKEASIEDNLNGR
jgi:hypothetical protein